MEQTQIKMTTCVKKHDFIAQYHTPKAMTLEEIQIEISRDREMVAVQNSLSTGRWHENPLSKPYESIKNELSFQNSLVLRGDRIVLPSNLRQKALEIVHEGHLGIERCKSLLRQKLYWPGLDKQVIEFISSCVACQANLKENAPTPIKMSKLPDQPWEEIAIDFCGRLPTGDSLFVIVDRYSRYPLVEIMKLTKARQVINRLKQIFAMFGYPKRIWSDNGPPFQSREFESFVKSIGAKHRKVTPRYPQANGGIERFMRVISKALKTGKFQGHNWREELNAMLLNYRTSTHAITGKTPSELFFNRQIQNKLPDITTGNPIECDEEVRKRQVKKYEKCTEHFNVKRNVKEINVSVGDKVFLKRDEKGDKFDSKFYKQIYIIKQIKGNMVIIESESGNTLARNIINIKKIKEYPKRQRTQTQRFDVQN